jgi:hypothetical protein
MTRREFLALALAAPVALAAAPAAFARRLGGTPVALVTADTEEHVAAIDLSTGRVVKRIPTLAGPRSIESAAATTAVIAHTDEGAVTLLDGPSLAVKRVLRAFSAPRYTASAPDGRLAYVTDSGRGELVTLDLVRGRIVHRLELDGPARHVTLDPTGRRLWTALGTKAQEIAVVALEEGERPRLLHVPRFSPTMLFSRRGAGRSGSLPGIRARLLSTMPKLARRSSRGRPIPRRSTSPSVETEPSSRAATTPRCACTRCRAAGF